MPSTPKPPALDTLLAAFSEIPDPRVERTRAHPLVNILIMALLGAMSGADGWEALEIFAQRRAELFKTFLVMPKGTPSADTFRRVFEALDPTAFQDAFRCWLQPLLENLKGQTIALDGKTLRGSIDQKPVAATTFIPQVSLYSQALGVAMAQTTYDTDENS